MTDRLSMDNAERHRRSVRLYNKTHPEKRNALASKFYAVNRERILAKARKKRAVRKGGSR